MKFSLLLALSALAVAAPVFADLPTAPVGPPIERAPEVFQVKLDTTVGDIVIEVTRANAPLGADKFYSMVKAKGYDGCRFFRVIPGTIVQFGIPADPAVTKVWTRNFPDDPRRVNNSNRWATVAYAKGPRKDSRTSQLFINLDDNRELDSEGFVPIGRVIQGMKKLVTVYSDYGGAPDQHKIETQGEAYLAKAYPKLDVIRTATVLPAK
jgi:peptidyl-prolyl cis-trans isomerase A (cyclophilin A)